MNWKSWARNSKLPNTNGFVKRANSVPGQWDARITDQVPDHRIAWESEGGEYTSGVVNFMTVNPNCTRVSLQLMYDPEGFVEKTGDALGVVSSRVEGDLKRFKEFIENRVKKQVHGGEPSGNK